MPNVIGGQALADGGAVTVTIERDARFFSITSNSFIVSIAQDGQLQIDFGDEFITHTALNMTLHAIPGQDGVFRGANISPLGEPVRQLFGRVKMNSAAATQLVELLNKHIEQINGLKKG